MTGKARSPADRLAQALVDLEASKQGGKSALSLLKSEQERIDALSTKLDGLSQSDRRRVLDAAGLESVSAAPRPITPLPASPMVLPPLAPPPAPNWGKWANMLDVELWQAVALTLNFEPEKLPIYLKAFDLLGDDPFRICPAQFLERLEIASSHGGTTLPLKPVHRLKARCVVHLPTFVIWAQSIWNDLPKPLAAKPAKTPAQPQPTPEVSPVTAAQPKHRRQEERVMEIIKSSGFDPLALPPREPGGRGVKAEVKATALKDATLFSDKSFEKAWERLRGYGDIAGG